MDHTVHSWLLLFWIYYIKHAPGVFSSVHQHCFLHFHFPATLPLTPLIHLRIHFQKVLGIPSLQFHHSVLHPDRRHYLIVKRLLPGVESFRVVELETPGELKLPLLQRYHFQVKRLNFIAAPFRVDVHDVHLGRFTLFRNLKELLERAFYQFQLVSLPPSNNSNLQEFRVPKPKKVRLQLLDHRKASGSVADC